MRARTGRATLGRAAVPGHLRSWLFDPRSLSRRLARACPGGFRVQLLSNAWRVPLASERLALGLAGRERALVREVLLNCHGEPWVFARSVMPRATLRGPQRRLAMLGPRPLGKVLFATPGMRRVRVTVSRAGHDPRMLGRCARALQAPTLDAWTRTSVFSCRGRSLLVSEIFLEAFARD